MFTPGQIVLWWRATPWGPACGVVVQDDIEIIHVRELQFDGSTRVASLALQAFSAEHAPRVVGRVDDGGQPRWGAR